MSVKPTYEELAQRVEALEKEAAERREVKEVLLRTTKLLDLIRKAQSEYIADADRGRVYKLLLETLIEITQSEHGFLDEVLQDSDGSMYKLNLAISDISWDDASRQLYRQLQARDLEFRNLNNLSGRPALTGETLITNDPASDPRSGGLPPGHPPIKSFMGMPLYFGGKLVGVAGVANRKGGYTKDMADFLNPLLTTCASITAAFRNEASKKEREKRLEESEQRYREFVEGTDDLIIRVDQDGRFIFVNHMSNEILGLSPQDSIGRSAFDFVHPDDKAHTLKWFDDIVAKQQASGTLENRQVSRDGTIHHLLWTSNFHYDSNGRLVGVNGIARDITDRKQLEEQLRQSHKMEAIGTLAGGVAHDFNNILGIILGNAELAMDDIPAMNPAKYNVEEIKTASLRAKDVVGQLLSFARKTDQDHKPADINSIATGALRLLRSSIPTSIELRSNISRDPTFILADPTQINQILINLCTNAVHAMETDGGVLDIGLDRVTLDAPTARSYELSPGRYVRMTVSDTGHGIDPEIKDRIFDPYFTTREVDKGSGMGLAVVHGIVTAHKGAIAVDSQVGKGATFNVFLPIVEITPVPETITEEDAPTGNERVLFVDDEASIVKMVRERLKRLGYQVESTTNPVEALDIFRSNPDRFDLVITDLTMPKLTGDKLIREILRLRPDMPIIICTGFGEKIDGEKATAIGASGYLEKPHGKLDLAKMIRRVLDAQ